MSKKLLLDAFPNVGHFLQNVLDNQYYFLHHMYLIHQTLFSGFLKKKQTLMRHTMCQMSCRADKEQFISVLLCVNYLLNDP